MPYIGKEPANSFISFEKQVFTIVNSQTAYTLDNAVTNENDIRLVINNIVQEPGSGKAYTASGTTLTLSAALVNGTDEMYCVFLGKAVQTVNTPDGSVTNTKISYPLAQSGAVVSSFNRTSSDGNILELQKDGTTVGSVASMSGANIQIGSGDVGLRFFDTSDAIYPVNNGTSLDRDNAIDLGRSGVRFKDLYLSGGVLLGGTDAAHTLDDYEEGAFTPEITDGIGSRTHSVQEGVYTKIGRICKFKLRVKLSSGSANSNRIGISGLPFTVFTDPPADGAYWSYLDSSVINSTSTNPPTLYQSRNTSSISFYKTSGADFTGNDLNSATPDFYIVGTYQTN